MQRIQLNLSKDTFASRYLFCNSNDSRNFKKKLRGKTAFCGDANLRRLERKLPPYYTLAWINIGIGNRSSSWVRRQSENTQASGPCAPDPWPFEPKINRLRDNVEDHYYTKFQVIAVRGFRFIVLTYRPNHIHTSWQSDRNIRAAVLRRRRG